MPRLSQTLSFLQIPSLQQAQSARIGQLTQCIVIGRTPQAWFGNVTPLSIIARFSFKINVKTVIIVLIFTISPRPKLEQSHVTDTVMKLVCVCTQVVVVWPCLPLSHTRARTHTTCKALYLSSHEQILKPITKHTVADSESPDCQSKVRITSSPRSTKLW